MDVKEKSKLFPPLLSGILNVIMNKIPIDLYDELVSRMIWYKFAEQNRSVRDPSKMVSSIKDFVKKHFSAQPTTKLVPLFNALATTNIHEMKKEFIRMKVERVIKEALGSLISPKFDAAKVLKLVNQFGHLNIYVDDKMYVLTKDMVKGANPKDATVFVSGEDGGEVEIRYDQIQYVEAGGKRIMEVTSGETK